MRLALPAIASARLEQLHSLDGDLVEPVVVEQVERNIGHTVPPYATRREAIRPRRLELHLSVDKKLRNK